MEIDRNMRICYNDTFFTIVRTWRNINDSISIEFTVTSHSDTDISIENIIKDSLFREIVELSCNIYAISLQYRVSLFSFGKAQINAEPVLTYSIIVSGVPKMPHSPFDAVSISCFVKEVVDADLIEQAYSIATSDMDDSIKKKFDELWPADYPITIQICTYQDNHHTIFKDALVNKSIIFSLSDLDSLLCTNPYLMSKFYCEMSVLCRNIAGSIFGYTENELFLEVHPRLIRSETDFKFTLEIIIVPKGISSVGIIPIYFQSYGNRKLDIELNIPDLFLHTNDKNTDYTIDRKMRFIIYSSISQMLSTSNRIVVPIALERQEFDMEAYDHFTTIANRLLNEIDHTRPLYSPIDSLYGPCHNFRLTLMVYSLSDIGISPLNVLYSDSLIDIPYDESLEPLENSVFRDLSILDTLDFAMKTSYTLRSNFSNNKLNQFSIVLPIYIHKFITDDPISIMRYTRDHTKLKIVSNRFIPIYDLQNIETWSKKKDYIAEVIISEYVS